MLSFDGGGEGVGRYGISGFDCFEADLLAVTDLRHFEKVLFGSGLALECSHGVGFLLIFEGLESMFLCFPLFFNLIDIVFHELKCALSIGRIFIFGGGVGFEAGEGNNL